MGCQGVKSKIMDTAHEEVLQENKKIDINGREMNK